MRTEYMPWLSVVATTGLTPSDLITLAETCVARGEGLKWARRENLAATRLRKWAVTGLPRQVFNYLRTDGQDNTHILEAAAYRIQDAADACSHKHEGHRNVVELRTDRPNRLCQVCGEYTEPGDEVIQGTRRRGEQSNRTGYCHLRCVNHLQIKEGEKVVRRELRVTNIPEKVVRGAQMKRQQCIMTGGKPTHVMWLNQSTCIEPVAFNIDEVKKV